MTGFPSLVMTAFASAACALGGCQTSSGIHVEQSTIDEIARCGAGVRISTDSGLDASIAKDIHGHRVSLSLQHEQLIKAAIIASNGSEPDQTDYLYSRYVECIEGRTSLDAEIASMKTRKDQTDAIFTKANVPDSDIKAWDALAEEAIGAASRMEFVTEARARNNAAVKYVQIAEAVTHDPLGLGPNIVLNVAPPPKQSAKQHAEEQALLSNCELFATKAMCDVARLQAGTQFDFQH